MKNKIGFRMGLLVSAAVILLACSLMPSSGVDKVSEAGNTEPSINTKTEDSSVIKAQEDEKTEFPLPDGAKILTTKNGTVTAQINMSINDLVAFYRQEWIDGQGLKEDNLLTIINDTSFSLVFNGSANGKKIVLQGTDFGDGSIAFSIRYE